MKQLQQARPERLPPFPRGWYAVAFSEEIKPGGVITRQLGGREVVLFRTASGTLGAVDPLCPHLGAHLGHGSRVEGESLRCPFHGFKFAADGACVATGYGTKPPRVRAKTWDLRENHGAVLLWLDPGGAAPSFEVPMLDATGFTTLRHKLYRLRGHPQDTTENSVDFGHLSVVHGYEQLRVIREVETEGPYLTARYGMHRPIGLFGQTFGERAGGVDAEFEVHVHGLGYSLVEVIVPKLGVEMRNFVFATPAGDMDLELRVAIAVRELGASTKLVSPLRLLARSRRLSRLVESLLHRQAFLGYVHDVEQDFVIWKHKRFVQRPALAQGDGPLIQYRRWAEQFYAPVEADNRRTAFRSPGSAPSKTPCSGYRMSEQDWPK